MLMFNPLGQPLGIAFCIFHAPCSLQNTHFGTNISHKLVVPFCFLVVPCSTHGLERFAHKGVQVNVVPSLYALLHEGVAINKRR